MNELLNPEFYTNMRELVGCKGTMTIYDEGNFEGVFVAFDIKTSEWMFEKVYRIGDNGLHTKYKDQEKVVIIPKAKMKSVQFEQDTKATKSSQFATDDQISSTTQGDSGAVAVVEVSEKDRSPWNDGDGEEIVDVELLSVINSLTSNRWEAQDMFKKNQDKYRVTSTFCPELTGYTTILDKTNLAVYKKQEELARKIAKEIEGNLTSWAWDRAQVENGDDVDEEQAFSAVTRIRPSSNINKIPNNPIRNGQPSSSTSPRINGNSKAVSPPKASNASQARHQPQHQDVEQNRPSVINGPTPLLINPSTLNNGLTGPTPLLTNPPTLNNGLNGPAPLLNNPPRRPMSNGNGGNSSYQNYDSRNYSRWSNAGNGNVYQGQDRRHGYDKQQYQYDTRRAPQQNQNHYNNNYYYSNGHGRRMDYVGNRTQQQQQRTNNRNGAIVTENRSGDRKEIEARKFQPPQNTVIKQEPGNKVQYNQIVNKTSPPLTSNNGPSTSSVSYRQQPPVVGKILNKNGKVASPTNVPALSHQANGQLSSTATTSSTDIKMKTESSTSISSTGTKNLSPKNTTAINTNNSKVTSTVPHRQAHYSGAVSSSNSTIKINTAKGSSGDKTRKFTFNPKAKEFESEFTSTSIPYPPPGNTVNASHNSPNDIPRRQPPCTPANTNNTTQAFPAPVQPQFSQHQNQHISNIQLPPPPPPPPFRQAQQQQQHTAAFTSKAQNYDDGTTYYHNHGGICLYNNQRRGGDGLHNASAKITPSMQMATSSGPPLVVNSVSGSGQPGGQGQPQNAFEGQRNAFEGQQQQYPFVPPRAYPPQTQYFHPQAALHQQQSAPVVTNTQAHGTTYYHNGNGHGHYQNGSLRRDGEGLLGVSSSMPEMTPSIQMTPSGPLLVTSAFVQPQGQPQHAQTTFAGQQYAFVPHGAYPRAPQIMTNGFVQTSGGLMPMPMFQPQPPRNHEVGPVTQMHPNVQYTQTSYHNGPAPGHQAMNYNQPWLPGMPQAEFHPMPLGYPPMNFIPVNLGYQHYVPPFQMAPNQSQFYPVPPPPGFNFVQGGPVYQQHHMQ